MSAASLSRQHQRVEEVWRLGGTGTVHIPVISSLLSSPRLPLQHSDSRVAYGTLTHTAPVVVRRTVSSDDFSVSLSMRRVKCGGGGGCYCRCSTHAHAHAHAPNDSLSSYHPGWILIPSRHLRFGPRCLRSLHTAFPRVPALRRDSLQNSNPTRCRTQTQTQTSRSLQRSMSPIVNLNTSSVQTRTHQSV